MPDLTEIAQSPRLPLVAHLWLPQSSQARWLINRDKASLKKGTVFMEFILKIFG